MGKGSSFTVRDMPKAERPRERLNRLGAEALSAQELLALIIGRGVSGRSVMTISQELMTEFGSIRAISEATIEQLSKIKGVGLAKAAQLKACFELGKRQELATESGYENYDIKNPQAVVDAIRACIKDMKKEHFMLMMLNTRNKIIRIENISVGTLNASLVHPREVFNKAIAHAASSVVIAHNHPSGDPEPSEEDLKITKRLIDAGRIIGIKVLDHIIIGKHGIKSAVTEPGKTEKQTYCSLKEKGLI
ncbi:MAG TPA: DNA repair protein RadC [Syntrophorhabdaceae bacterium]|nr:DNA repair protein RadC [Syntrophorhabdaceae bacterium]